MTKLPFRRSVKDFEKAFGLSTDEALQRVQAHYASFKARNDRLIERQDDSANAASIHLINQVTLVATATVTFSGAFAGVVYKTLTIEHSVLFLLIAASEILALTLAMYDYHRTVRFHNAWAKVYHDIDQEVESEIKSGAIQYTERLREIESSYIGSMPREAGSRIRVWIIFSTASGAWLFLVLLAAYFFDIPFMSGHSLGLTSG